MKNYLVQNVSRAETETPCPNSTFRRSSWFCSSHQLFWDWSLHRETVLSENTAHPVLLGLSGCPDRLVTPLALPFSSVHVTFAQSKTQRAPSSLSSPPPDSRQGCPWSCQCRRSPWPQLQWSLQQKGRWGMAEGKILNQIKLYNFW